MTALAAEGDVAQVGDTTYSTLQEAFEAADNGNTVTLLQDTTYNNRITVNKNVTLDLGGNTLTSETAHSFVVNQNVIFTMQNGTIYNQTGVVAFALKGATITLAENATLECKDGISGTNNKTEEGGATFNIYGDIHSSDIAVWIQGPKNTVTIDGAELTGKYFTVYQNGSFGGNTYNIRNSTIQSDGEVGPAIYISNSKANTEKEGQGWQILTVEDSTITGPTGIEGKYTNMTLSNCNITATAKPSYTQNNNGSTALGFAVVSTDNATNTTTPVPEGTISINGGTYDGIIGLSQFEEIDDYEEFKETNYSVTAGTFSSDVSAYLAEDYAVAIDAAGNYKVLTEDEVDNLPTDGDGNYYLDNEAAEANNAAAVNGTYYSTIQAAINAAHENGTVYVYAGEHDGSIVINKDLTLVGPTDGDAIITISDTTASAIQKQIAINGETTPYSGIVAVANADATLQNITIRGNEEAASQVTDLTHNNRYAGLVALNASVTMENCNIEDITYTDGPAGLQGMQNGFGIYAVAQNNETLTLTNVDITNFNKAAAVIRSDVDLVMTGGSVVGFGEQSVISQNGIQYAGDAMISGTTFSGLKYVADNEWSGGSTAIYNLGEGTTSTIENVTTTGVDYSVSADAPTTITSGNYDGDVYGYDDNLTIGGGTFASSVAQYVAEDLKYEAYRDNIGYTYHKTLEDALDTGGVVKSIQAAIAVEGEALTVTFIDRNDTTKIEVTSKESVTLPTRSDYGYNHFVGWNDGSKTHDAGAQVTISKDTTFTAVWSYIPPANPNYKITIGDTANGTVTADPAAAKAGAKVTLTATPDEGYALSTLTVTDRFGDAVKVTENADGTYTFTMPNGQVTVKATFVETQEPAPAEPFPDVDENDWFYDEVVYVYENGLMNGVENNRFAPNTATNRAMLATILYRLAGEPAVSGDLPFTDVESGTWYTDAVLWAAQNGIVNGLGENTFAPMNTLTREQLVTMLYRYAEAAGYDVSAAADLSGYPDAGKVQTYAQEAMSWAVAEGIVEGMDGNLNPAGNASRAQIATILMRFCEDVAQ